MALIVTSQTILAEDVSASVVTEVVQDASGKYIREYRFYGPGSTVGGDGPLLLTVRVQASEATPLRFETGNLTI